ncbi:MAG TPA: hypothetical protein VLN46_04035 [Gillisia sp.]|nr:hypothetical protein [Gillisia sp.]
MEVQAETAVDTSALYANINYPERDVVLLPEAQEITENWLAFLTAQSEIDNFRTYTVKEITDNATPIAEIMQNLRDTAPKEFGSHAAQTRLSVLFTKAKVLEFLSNKRNPDYAQIRSTAEELPVEFNNFKIQLNELFLKTLEDLELELDTFDAEDTTGRPLLRTVPRMGRQN